MVAAGQVAAERRAFRREYGDLYSFYALEPEYALLEKLVNKGAALLGSDQVVMYADRLVFQDWAARTENPKAREIYAHVVAASKQAFDRFLERPEARNFTDMYFMTVHEIGNLVANLAEARYEQSFHVMILGESGSQASPFRGFAVTPVDPDGFYPKHLKPLFSLTEGPDWSVFDLEPLRRAYEKGKLALDDRNRVRSLKGYDALVLIPVVTPAAFPDLSAP